MVNVRALQQLLKNPHARTGLKKLIDLIDTTPETLGDEGITCELCDNADWWPQNGFSEAERQAICGPNGIGCPGFGGM